MSSWPAPSWKTFQLKEENYVAQPRLIHKITAPLRVSIGSAGSRHPFTPSIDTRLKANGSIWHWVKASRVRSKIFKKVV